MRVLSLDGGGIRGLIQILIIEKMLELANDKFENLFDYVIGTSIGGIMGAALTVSNDNGNAKYSAHDVFKMFTDNAELIFPKDHCHAWILEECLYRSKYKRDSLDKFLEEKLGDSTFLDTVLPFATLSYSMELDEPRIWSTCRAQQDKSLNYKLKDATGATSAAPTYFPVKHTIHNNKNMYDVDGGIFANAPIIEAMADYKQCSGMEKIRVEDVIIISIGTGKFLREKKIISDTNLDYGIVEWLKDEDLVNRIMLGTQLDAVESASKLFRVSRINPDLDAKFAPIDKIDKEYLVEFEATIRNYINQHLGFLQIIVDCLQTKDHSFASLMNNDAHPCGDIIYNDNVLQNLLSHSQFNTNSVSEDL